MAADHKRSAEAEGRRLSNAERGGSDTRKALGSHLRARFAEIGLDEDLPELRGEAARPAAFEKLIVGDTNVVAELGQLRCLLFAIQSCMPVISSGIGSPHVALRVAVRQQHRIVLRHEVDEAPPEPGRPRRAQSSLVGEPVPNL